MIKSEIKIGKDYVFRERGNKNALLQRVRMLENVRGYKWKAEWIDPNPGLVDYVDSRLLLVRWKDRNAYLRDEESKKRLIEDNLRNKYQLESPLDNAVSSVFESIGERTELYYWKGSLSGNKEALERVLVRAKLKTNESIPYSYIDRQGTIHISFFGALKIAKAFCMAEPQPVLAYIESWERKWSQDALRLGEEYMVGLLNNHRAAWAIVRQWTGPDAVVVQRDEYIKQLERLVWDAVYVLQKVGAENEAAKLRRAMRSD
jgi:hypothetical protein